MTRVGIQDETSLNLQLMLVDLWVTYKLLTVGLICASGSQCLGTILGNCWKCKFPSPIPKLVNSKAWVMALSCVF